MTVIMLSFGALLAVEKCFASQKEGDKLFVVVYCQGEPKLTYLPEYGETKVFTHKGYGALRLTRGEEF